jgi:hypothetical protein
MLFENKLLIVDQPWKIISHYKKFRIQFSTGPAAGA